MKASVTVTFNLGTSIEPEVNDYHWDTSGITDFKGESYFSSESLTVSGGSLSFTVEDDSFEDEDDVKEWVRSEVINDDNEVEDQNGITWTVEDLDIEVEIEESPLPSLDEALQTLGAFAEEKREDSEWGEIARAAIVVIDAFTDITTRLSNLEAQMAALVASAQQSQQ
jgi:hypothetical protein